MTSISNITISTQAERINLLGLDACVFLKPGMTQTRSYPANPESAVWNHEGVATK